MTRFLAAAFVVTRLAVAAGPPTPRAPVAKAPTAAPASAPRPSAVPDADIEKAIRARFARSKISTNGFTVRVQAGVAILEGKTGVIQHKGTATRLAKRAGARRVDNRIQISDEARQQAAGRLAQGRAARVKVSQTK